MSEPIEPAPGEKQHVIRLVAAWGLERSPDGFALWRRFGAPAGLTPRHRVMLVLTGVLAAGRVTLNGLPLAASAGGVAVGDGRIVRCRFDVTGRLLHRNELRVEEAGRLRRNSLPHVRDDVPGAEHPRKPEVSLPGKSRGGLFPGPASAGESVAQREQLALPQAIGDLRLVGACLEIESP